MKWGGEFCTVLIHTHQASGHISHWEDNQFLAFHCRCIISHRALIIQPTLGVTLLHLGMALIFALMSLYE